MSKEKKPFQVRFSMRVFFTIFIVAELLVIYTVAGLLVALPDSRSWRTISNPSITGIITSEMIRS